MNSSKLHLHQAARRVKKPMTHSFNGLVKRNPDSSPAPGSTEKSAMSKIEQLLEKWQMPREV